MTSPHAVRGLRRFREECRDSFIPLDFCSPDESDEFLASSFVTRELGALKVTQVVVSSSLPFQGQLTRGQIGREALDEFVLLISRKGRARHWQFGRTGVTVPGRMILIHSRTPYQVQTETDMSSMHINIPGSLLRPLVGAPEDYCMIPMDAGQGLNALFCEFLHSIWHKLGEIGESHRDFLAREFVGFLVRSLEDVDADSEVAARGSSEDRRFEQALSFIDQNLSDPALGVEQVARELQLSHGRLHAIARSKGTSIGQTILDRRLVQCARALADPRCRHRGITQIAFDWGFKNASHFSDVFKAKFGVAPRAFRKRQLEVS